MTVDDSTLPAVEPPLAGRYAIGPEIGRGSTATVHRARDIGTGREVALKLFDTASSAGPDRLRREIDVLTGLRHPGLVALLDSGRCDGHLFVVMDLVEGRSLEAALTEQPLAPPAVTELGARLADALAHVHGRGIVHRDIKPANILLDRAGRPRLADFGIARLDGATRMTATGVVIGTAAYMAPEQVRGATVGPPADIYSLGLVLLEALTGLREYTGSAVEAAIARLHRPPTVPTGLPPALARTLRRMTASEPARRPSAAEVAELLGGPATAVTPVAGRPARRLVPAAALGVLAAGVLGGWLLTQAGGSPVASAAGTAPTQQLVVLPPAVDAAPTGAVPPPAAVAEPVAVIAPIAAPAAAAQEPARHTSTGTGRADRGAATHDPDRKGPDAADDPAGSPDADGDEGQAAGGGHAENEGPAAAAPAEEKKDPAEKPADKEPADKGQAGKDAGKGGGGKDPGKGGEKG
jgi:hypothetical protein